MQEFRSHQFTTEGCPEWGCAYGPGFEISWQRGPLGRGAARSEPNGAFVVTILEAAADRIAYFQNSKFACEENRLALHHLSKAIEALQSRTAAREARGVEGTSEV